jgi:hypothetical protein
MPIHTTTRCISGHAIWSGCALWLLLLGGLSAASSHPDVVFGAGRIALSHNGQADPDDIGALPAAFVQQLAEHPTGT